MTKKFILNFLRPQVKPITIPPRDEVVANVEESVETSSETFAAVVKRMEEAEEAQNKLKMEVEEAEALAEAETQKYADKLQMLLKNNAILRRKKQRALELAREAREWYLSQKAALEEAENDEDMSTPIEPNAVDDAIDEVQAENAIEN